jgi:hypothetical protein
MFVGSAPDTADLLYSDSNEDIEASLRALEVRPRCLVVGVTGSADLLLLALRYNPAFVAGYDVNPAQNALGELKRGAIHILPYDDYVSLLGYGCATPAQREQLLRNVVEHLEDDVATYWRHHRAVALVRKGLWRSGSSTERDLAQWTEALSGLLARLGTDDFEVALGLRGTAEQREAIRDRVAREDPRYERTAYHHGSGFKFDVFRFKGGIANHASTARFAAAFLPNAVVRPPIGPDDYHVIRSRLHRIAFQTRGVLQALDEMPSDAFDRAYLSNVTEYFTVAEERALANKLLAKARPHARTVLLYVAFSPAAHRDLLDHSTWTERGVRRLVRAELLEERARVRAEHVSSQLKQRLRQFDANRAASTFRGVGAQLRHLARGTLLQRTKVAARRWDAASALRQIVQRGEATLRELDVTAFAQDTVSRAQRLHQSVREQWLDTRQFEQPGHVLIENEDRSRALYADVDENFRVTAGAKSFYDFSYAILFSVARDGPVYRLPTDGGQRPATR